MKKAALSFLILAIAMIGACNRTSDRAPAGGAPTASPTVPPSMNQSPSAALEPKAPSGGSTSSSTQQEPPSKELSKREESTAMPRPGQGGADHSTPAREPDAKG
jgi:hypothetical protein